MEKKTLHCVKCGADITRSMKIYPYGYRGGAYCYDCAEGEKKPFKSRYGPSDMSVREMYSRGYTPSEIAQMKWISKEEVYEQLQKRKR